MTQTDDNALPPVDALTTLEVAPEAPEQENPSIPPGAIPMAFGGYRIDY